MEAHFDFGAVFEPDDYLYFYRDALTKERTEKEMEFLVEKLGHQITGVDVTLGFLNIAKRDAREKG